MSDQHGHVTGHLAGHAWTQDHVYLGEGHARAERRTRLVTYFTAVFMAVEIAAGLAFGSMALLADGVHMATHVGALGLAALAYALARRHAGNRRFSFGSGKFGDLAGFASALVLGVLSLGVAVESLMRLFTPVSIHYPEAIGIAAVGLCVNIISALMLRDSHGHDHGHGHEDAHGEQGHAHDHEHSAEAGAHKEHDHERHGHTDNNLRAAYVHILADAATSVLALIALSLGAAYGWSALDPLVGLLGAAVIAQWSTQLLRQTGYVLLDVEDDPKLADAIRHTLVDVLKLQVADLHLWRLGPGHRGMIVSLVSAGPCSADDIKRELKARHDGLSHVTVEVTICGECANA